MTPPSAAGRTSSTGELLPGQPDAAAVAVHLAAERIQVRRAASPTAAYWLAGTTPAWSDAVRAACIDLCSIYASALCRMLPHAVLTMDLTARLWLPRLPT
jgi:hypothetical protein